LRAVDFFAAVFRAVLRPPFAAALRDGARRVVALRLAALRGAAFLRGAALRAAVLRVPALRVVALRDAALRGAAFRVVALRAVALRGAAFLAVLLRAVDFFFAAGRDVDFFAEPREVLRPDERVPERDEERVRAGTARAGSTSPTIGAGSPHVVPIDDSLSEPALDVSSAAPVPLQSSSVIYLTSCIGLRVHDSLPRVFVTCNADDIAFAARC